MLATPSPRTDQEPEPEIHRPDRPTMVLLNPRAAGGQAAALAQPVRSWLAAHAPGVALVESDSIERSRATLQCLPRSSRVVLIGGDGTLHHMLPVLLTHRLALGVVPLGSGNDTARALGVAELPWAKALDLALRGPTRRMDVGELVTPRQRVPFFSSLAAGFDAAVGRRAIDSPRWLSGTSRYVWAEIRSASTRGRCRRPSSSPACRGRWPAQVGVRRAADDGRAVGRHRAQAAPELGLADVAAVREQVGHHMLQRAPARLAQVQAEAGQLGRAAHADAVAQARHGHLVRLVHDGRLGRAGASVMGTVIE
jgi:hypothetical protein